MLKEHKTLVSDILERNKAELERFGTEITPIKTNLHPKGEKKRWVYGPSVGPGAYHVSMHNLQGHQMEQFIEKGGCGIVIGGYGTGKTSHFNHLREQLLKTGSFIILSITFRVFDLQTIGFWVWMGHEISRHHKDMLGIFTLSDFNEFISKQPKDKKLVLLFDEFHVLTHFPISKKELLGSLKVHCQQGTIHSVLAFETLTTLFDPNFSMHSIQKEWNEKGSVFSYENVIYLLKLPPQEVKEIFLEWAYDHQVQISPDVIDDIILTTGCYPGLVGFIGSQLHSYITGNSVLDVERWSSFAPSLPELLLYTDQYSRLRNVIQSSPQLKHFIIYNIFPHNSWTINENIPSSNDVYLEILADYGLLTRSGVSGGIIHFVISAPPVYHLLLNTFASIQRYEHNNNPEILWDFSSLVKDLLCNLDITILSNPLTWNKSTQFPSKYSFQALLYARIVSLSHAYKRKNSMNVSILIFPRGKDCEELRCFLVDVGNGRRFLMALKATNYWIEESFLEQELLSLKISAKIYQCEQILFLNFLSTSIVPPSARMEYEMNGVRVFHLSLSLSL